MSEPQKPNDKTDPGEVQGHRRRNGSYYLGVIASGFAAFLVRLGYMVRKDTAKEAEQRADEHLIAAATDKMARYTKWLVVTAAFSVAAALGTLYLINGQSSDDEASKRAFVFQSGDGNFAVQDGVGHFQVKWTNTGDTPTKNLRLRINAKQFDGEMPENFTFPDVDEVGNVIDVTKQPSRSLIGPKATVGSGTVRVSPENMAAIDTRGQPHPRFYVWGWARYGDVFNPRSRHLTRFCEEITTVIVTDKQVGTQTQGCPIGNCADDECRQEGIP